MWTFVVWQRMVLVSLDAMGQYVRARKVEGESTQVSSSTRVGLTVL